MSYLYAICPKPHTYYSKIIEKFLQESSEWQKTDDKAMAHFCDCDPHGLIKCRLSLKNYIFDKAVLARILRNVKYHPPTLIINRNGKISDPRLSKWIQDDENTKGKYFFKPAMSGGGVGIQVLSKVADYRKFAKSGKEFVIQKGVPSMLYQGKKFDIRTYILVVVSQKNIYFYISKDSCMRISSFLYDEKNLNKGINVTNLSYQKLAKTSTTDAKNPYRNSLSLSLWEHYNVVFPKMKEALKEIAGQLALEINRKPTVALLGCDFLIDNDLEPHFLEINVNIGFSIHIRPPETALMLKEMIREIISVGYEPLIKNIEPPVESNQWIRCYQE